jgi:hypothetical protein
VSKKIDKIAKALGADRVMDPIALALENRQLREAFAAAKRELAEHKHLFEMQHDRTHHAEIIWREHHGKPNVSPDLGTLIQWLLDRGDRWQSVVKAARAAYRNRGPMARINAMPALEKALKEYDSFYDGMNL